MKSILLVGLVCLCLTAVSLAEQENCVEQPTDPCANFTEYTAYMTCLDEKKRHKRSVGCPLLQAESCEYVDCQTCQETCLPDCPECECPSTCRQCCSETCTSNLCCHKTCHNQCKTNYCRTECKRDCKERINQQGSSSDTDLDINIREGSSMNNTARHNITTIINLHNIINNTNLIDIPIKINNTNFNNITLKRTEQMNMRSQFGGQFGGQIGQSETTSSTGEKCCYIVSPRQCVKTNYYPFMKCFHYRHRKCGPFCIATIIHAQNQNYCDNSGCHNKIFYVPQIQPRCYYTPNYPFVNCGGQQTFHNCQGCYDHISSGTATTGIHHHMRCSRCYDSNAGSPMPQMMQPPMMQGYPMGMGYPMGYPMAYGSYGGNPLISPMYPAYGQPVGYGQQPGIQFYGQNVMDNDIIDTQSNFNAMNSNYPVSHLLKSGSTDSNVNDINPSYPAGNPVPYVLETVVPVTKLLKSGSTENGDNNKSSLEESSTGASKYALISIDAPKPYNHHKREDKEKKARRKKNNKNEHEHTTERKKDGTSTEKKL